MDKKITESVKIDKVLVDKVRELKKTTKLPIGSYIELAIEEKILSTPKKLKS